MKSNILIIILMVLATLLLLNYPEEKMYEPIEENTYLRC